VRPNALIFSPNSFFPCFLDPELFWCENMGLIATSGSIRPKMPRMITVGRSGPDIWLRFNGKSAEVQL